MGYTLLYDRVSRYYEIIDSDYLEDIISESSYFEGPGKWPFGHFEVIGEHLSEEALEAELEELRGPTRFCVFHDRARGDVKITQENGLSGNWKGSKYGTYSFDGEFDSLEEAEVRRQEILSWYKA